MNVDRNILNQLIDFHVSNELAEIEKIANRTNIFDVLKITSAEIRHSNMLAWLLNPQNPHGFGNTFFKEIALMALLDDSYHGCFDTQCTTKGKKFNCFNSEFTERAKMIDLLINNDFSDLKVYREYANIDLLLVSHKEQFVCVIENKVEAEIEETQLKRYAETVYQEFKTYQKLFIVFSVHQYDEINCNRYYRVSYVDFYNLLQKNYNANKIRMNDDNKVLVRQYIESIRRYLMSNGMLKETDYIKLCKAIYKNHKSAIDDILKYGRPGINPEVMKKFYDLTDTTPVNGNKDAINTFQYFIPEDWKKIIPLKSDYSSEKYLAVLSLNLSNISNTDIDGMASVKMGVHITKPVHDFKQLRDEFADKAKKSPDKKVGATYYTLASVKVEINMGDVFEDTQEAQDRIVQNLKSVYEDKSIQDAIKKIKVAANEMCNKNVEWKKACE